MRENWRRLVVAFLTDTRASVAAEHALLLGLIAFVIFAAVTLFGNTVSINLFQTSIALLPFTH